MQLITQRKRNINSNENMFYPFIVSVKKCGGNCSTIDYPYARVCIPNKVKPMNLKVINVKCKRNKIFSSTGIVGV